MVKLSSCPDLATQIFEGLLEKYCECLSHATLRQVLLSFSRPHKPPLSEIPATSYINPTSVYGNKCFPVGMLNAILLIKPRMAMK
jgi:hypothetical protein